MVEELQCQCSKIDKFMEESTVKIHRVGTRCLKTGFELMGYSSCVR